MTNFEHIKNLIDESTLPSDEKMGLISIFAEIPDESLNDVRELFTKDASWIQKLSDNRKKKQEALSTGNRELWEEIMKEEKKYLDDLTFDRD